MKRGRPITGGNSRNSDYYVKKVRSSDALGCDIITKFFKRSVADAETLLPNDPIQEPKLNNSSSQAQENEISNSENTDENSALSENVEENSTFFVNENSLAENAILDSSLDSISHDKGSKIKKSFDDEIAQKLKCQSTEYEEFSPKKQHPLNIQKFEKLHNWIYYSVSAVGFLCKICSVCYSQGPWVDQGVNFGDHPTRCINKHETSSRHKQAVVASEMHFKKSLSESLVEGTKVAAEKAKENNQKLMTKYIKILYFMIKKQWAVTENFASLVKFIGKDLGDKDIESFLNACNKNSTYLSNISVQNLTEAISIFLEEKTITELQVSKYFALLADESTDEAQREQLGLIIRYKVPGIAEVKEQYLGLINLSLTNAESITSAIENFLIAKNIEITNCLFISLDGANVMSGDISGVQRRIRHLSPHSLFINCRNHRLALVFAHLLKKYKILQAVDALLVSLWKLFHYSPTKQQLFKDIQKDVYSIQVLKTFKVSVTRWLSHGMACERVVDRYQQLVETLDAIFDKTKEPEIKGIREQLLDINNLLCILFLADILKIINKLSTWLQSPNIMFSNITEKVTSIISEVEKYVSDLPDGKNFKKSNDLLIFVKECTELSRKNRKHQKQNVNPVNDVNDFINDFVKAFLIDFKAEMENAFEIKNDALAAFDVFNSFDLNLKVNDSDKTCLSTLISFYGQEKINEFQGAIKISPPIVDAADAVNEVPAFEKEMSLAKITFDVEKGMKAKTFLKEDKQDEAKMLFEKKITPLEALNIITRDSTPDFPNMIKLLSLSTIIPSSTASVERLFSRMNLVCTELKTRLKQETLDRHLRIIINGPEKLSDTECKAIIDIFKSTRNRRLLL